MSPRKVCDNCDGEGYTDMGASACAVCLGAGVTTPEMLAALGHASVSVVGIPMLVKNSRGWEVLGEDGARFSLVAAHGSVAK